MRFRFEWSHPRFTWIQPGLKPIVVGRCAVDGYALSYQAAHPIDYPLRMTTHDKFRGIPKWLLAIMLIISAAIIYGVIDWIVES